VVDEYLVLGVGRIAGIHDEPRQMAETVDPEGVAMEVARGGLELDSRRGFVLIAVQDYFLDGFVVFVIIHQSSKQLVHHSSLHAVSLSGLSLVLQERHASLDQVGNSLPLRLPLGAVEELDSAIGVLDRFLAVCVHRPDLHARLLLGPVHDRRDPEELITGLGNERLGHSHVAHVQTQALVLWFVFGDQVVDKCLRNISVERLHLCISFLIRSGECS
jgi:hypothetical protein